MFVDQCIADFASLIERTQNDGIARDIQFFVKEHLSRLVAGTIEWWQVFALAFANVMQFAADDNLPSRKLRRSVGLVPCRVKFYITL